MYGPRLGLLVLLALGLGVFAGLQDAQRDRASRALDNRKRLAAALETAALEADLVERENAAPVRLLAPWHEHDEGWWLPPEDEEFGDPGPRARRTKPAAPADLPKFGNLRGSRSSLKAWLQEEIRRLRDAAPGTPAALHLEHFIRLLRRLLKEGSADPTPPVDSPRSPRPFSERPPPGGLPAAADGSGLW
jgi:hypothetical protein